MSKKRDSRVRPFSIEAREAPDGMSEIVGYASVFNQIAYGEVIRPGAFSKTLRESKEIKAYWGHDSNEVLASRSNGTLELEEDEVGLHVVIKPNLETTWGKNALASVARGDVDKMSFRFSPITVSRETIDGQQVDVVKEVRLWEVSPVAEPWYQGTSASARDDEEAPAAADETPEAEEADTSWQARAAARKRQLQLLEMCSGTKERRQGYDPRRVAHVAHEETG